MYFFVNFPKNTAMEWYFVVLIVLSVIVFVLIFPLFIQLRFYVNVLENLGAVSVTLLWIFPIMNFRFNLKRDVIHIVTKKQKEKDIQIFSVKSYLILQFFKNLFLKLKIFEIYFFSYFGKKNDAMTTAMLNGYIVSLTHMLFVLIQNKKGEYISNIVCDKDFEKSELKFSFYSSIFILPISILFCFLQTLCKVNKKRRAK